MHPGRYDAARRRRSQRHGQEAGAWVYLPAEELLKTGIDLSGPPPAYRVWAGPRGRVVIQLYKET